MFNYVTVRAPILLTARAVCEFLIGTRYIKSRVGECRHTMTNRRRKDLHCTQLYFLNKTLVISSLSECAD